LSTQGRIKSLLLRDTVRRKKREIELESPGLRDIDKEMSYVILQMIENKVARV